MKESYNLQVQEHQNRKEFCSTLYTFVHFISSSSLLAIPWKYCQQDFLLYQLYHHWKQERNKKKKWCQGQDAFSFCKGNIKSQLSIIIIINNQCTLKQPTHTLPPPPQPLPLHKGSEAGIQAGGRIKEGEFKQQRPLEPRRKAVSRTQRDILHGKQSYIQNALHSPIYTQFKVLSSNRSTDTENRLVVAKEEEGWGGIAWESGISRCKLLYI